MLSLDEFGCRSQFRGNGLVEPLMDRHATDPQHESPPPLRLGLEVDGVHCGIGRSAGCLYESESQPAKHTYRDLDNAQLGLLSSSMYCLEDNLKTDLFDRSEQRQSDFAVTQSKFSWFHFAFTDHHHSENPFLGHATPPPSASQDLAATDSRTRSCDHYYGILVHRREEISRSNSDHDTRWVAERPSSPVGGASVNYTLRKAYMPRRSGAAPGTACLISRTCGSALDTTSTMWLRHLTPQCRSSPG